MRTSGFVIPHTQIHALTLTPTPTLTHTSHPSPPQVRTSGCVIPTSAEALREYPHNLSMVQVRV